MSCHKFIISIYDTSLIPVGGPEPLNYAAKGDVALIYEGGDEKLFNLFNSRLTFSLEVPLNDSTEVLYYEELFTGDEFRFKVVVTDETASVLWSGFMLPDSYQEPYTTGTFYVKFLATDGIAKLKGKSLTIPGWYPFAWYQARHSISKVIAECLQLTNLELEIRVDPAIENEGAGRRLDKVFINGGTWYDGENKAESAYKVLEDVLLEIGGVLFQQDNYWYIIGINKRSAPQTTFNRYDYNGVYIGDTGVNINHSKYLAWDASPQVTMLPPYKKVTIDLGIEAGLPIFPDDIVRQDWEKKTEPQDPPASKYWIATGDPYNGEDFIVRLANENWETNNDWPTYVDATLDLTAVVAGSALTSIQPAGWLLAHYISLKNPPYVSGGNGETIDFSFEYVSWWPIPANHNWIETVDNDVIVFQILLNGVTIASNKAGFTGRENFYIENTEAIIQKNGFTNSKITSKVDYKGLTLSESGLLDIRFHHPGDAESAGLTAIMEYYAIQNLKITHNKEETNVFTKTRHVDYTKTYGITLAHGDSVLSNTFNNFIIQDLIADNDFSEIQLITTAFIEGYGYCLRFQSGGAIYDYVEANMDRLYFQRWQSDYPEYLDDFELFQSNGLNFIRISFLDGHLPLPFGKLLVRYATPDDPQTPTFRDYRESWKKSTNSNGYDRYGNVLAELMHDINEKPTVVMEGESKWLLWPLQMLAYGFGNKVKKFLPTRLTLKPGENTTRVTAIEYINENVQDYE